MRWKNSLERTGKVAHPAGALVVRGGGVVGAGGIERRTRQCED